MASRVVPGCSPTARHNSMTSESGPTRDDTGRLSVSEWVGERVVENPSPPAAIERLSSVTIFAISSGVASRSSAASPIT